MRCHRDSCLIPSFDTRTNIIWVAPAGTGFAIASPVPIWSTSCPGRIEGATTVLQQACHRPNLPTAYPHGFSEQDAMITRTRNQPVRDGSIPTIGTSSGS